MQALSPTHEVTVLLRAWREGDERALDALIPLVHDELRRIARRCLHGDRARHSVQATELVNEAFLRLVDVQQIDWQNRTHFLAMSARLMRRVLVDLARSRGADKRGGDLATCQGSGAREVDRCKVPIRLALRGITEGANPDVTAALSPETADAWQRRGEEQSARLTPEATPGGRMEELGRHESLRGSLQEQACARMSVEHGGVLLPRFMLGKLDGEERGRDAKCSRGASCL